MCVSEKRLRVKSMRGSQIVCSESGFFSPEKKYSFFKREERSGCTQGGEAGIYSETCFTLHSISNAWTLKTIHMKNSSSSFF